jgi:hypothetical protein
MLVVSGRLHQLVSDLYLLPQVVVTQHSLAVEGIHPHRLSQVEVPFLSLMFPWLED